MDYREAGVDTEKAGRLIKDLSARIKQTHQPNRAGAVTGAFGGFAGTFKPAHPDWEVVATTDGVGTKLQVCRQYNILSGVGQDLVAMCVNDLYCTGAIPAFFLDYIACGRLNESWYQQLLESIVAACELSCMALLGGETAEHPGVMPDDDFDLAGFCVGFVHSAKKLPRLDMIKPGMKVYALPSSGLHSNGFSLVRRLIKDTGFIEKAKNVGWMTEHVLKPTRIYTEIPKIIEKFQVSALAHITGGGVYENLPRVLPEGMGARLTGLYDIMPQWYNEFKPYIPLKNMYQTFNMGAGIMLIAEADFIRQAGQSIPDLIEIGEVTDSLGIIIDGVDN